MTVPPRLSHLLELADQGPALRAALTEEVAELLLAWPADYPATMRSTCETLLARAVRDTDSQTRGRLRAKLQGDPELAARVLPREAAARILISAARGGASASRKLAQLLGVAPGKADDILGDASGRSLAVAAKAMHLGRADFSTLALLCLPKPKRERAAFHALLNVYDEVPAAEAARALRTWRGKAKQAAE